MVRDLNLRAYAKINLSLDVLGTLPNGYHEVRMVMQTVGLYDKINLRRNRTGKITVKTNLGYLPTGRENLVYRAAELLMKEFSLADGLNIDLYKYIPVAAGLAGGSSDAAAVLRGLNQMYGLGLSREELMERGKTLGADIPYCLMGGTALAEGIGERLTPLADCPGCYVILAKPAVSISTRYVYEHLILDETTKHPDTDGMLAALAAGSLGGVCDHLDNILESVTGTENPVIGEIEDFLEDNGAIRAVMSGSGPTVFGIFDNKETATTCYEKLRAAGLAKNVYLAEPIGREAALC